MGLFMVFSWSFSFKQQHVRTRCYLCLFATGHWNRSNRLFFLQCSSSLNPRNMKKLLNGINIQTIFNYDPNTAKTYATKKNNCFTTFLHMMANWTKGVLLLAVCICIVYGPWRLHKLCELVVHLYARLKQTFKNRFAACPPPLSPGTWERSVRLILLEWRVQQSTIV